MHETMKRLYQAALELKDIDDPGRQSKVARLLNVSSQTVNNWEARGISKEGVLVAQDKIGCLAKWVQSGEGEMSVMNSLGGRPVIAIGDGDPLPEGFVQVPEYKVSFSAGSGSAHYEENTDVKPRTYDVEWFREKHINPKHVKRVKVRGDSMEPTLFNGD